MFRIKHFYFICFVLFLCACSNGNKEQDRNGDQLIAEVYDQKLYVSDVLSKIPKIAISQDSQQLIRSYAERWVRDQLFLAEAQNNLIDEPDLDAMVEAYRQALILHRYEELLIGNLLDTTISQVDLENFYQSEKAQFILEKPLYRFRYLSVHSTDPNYYLIRQWWNSDKVADRDSIMKYCIPDHCHFGQTDSNWVYKETIDQLFPIQLDWEGRLSSDNEYIYWGDERRYIVKVLKKIDEGEYAPLEYVKNRLNSLILHDRKRKLLIDVQNDLYNRAVQNSRLKMHVK